MSPQELVTDLARAIRDAVRPRLGQGREVVGTTESGDASFALDLVAEEAMSAYLAASDLSVAVYSEDGGLAGPADAEWLLVVDPIDGTRPAKAGLECCCVSVALARNVPGATLGDVIHAAVAEIKGDAIFAASRGEGTVVWRDGTPGAPTPSGRRELSGAAMSVEITGRPIVPLAQALEDVIDGGSLQGGAFMFASTTFAVTRLVTGQLDLHVDVADRLRRDRPDLDPLFRRAGVGRPIALFAYDLAAVVLVAREAGVPITDAYGAGLETVSLTEVTPQWHRSCLAAGNAELHSELLAAVERGVARVR